jgi:LytS/YehU family sensor histidine kinase
VASLCTGAALAYDYRVRSARRAAVLREARLQAAGVLRRTAEVRLQALQARIDPRFLFDALAAVERIHDIDAAAGDRLLDNLIKYLRAVMPDLVATRSTVGKEVALARVWLAIRHAIVGATTVHAIEATGDVGNLPFPAMTMIPLAEAVLSEAPASATLTVNAQCEGALTTVRIDCRAPCAAEPPSVPALRARLEELYGEQVRLAFTCDARGRQATVEVDHAQSDSDHR